jgi:chemotaxis family two-component system response regulator Rcp1
MILQVEDTAADSLLTAHALKDSPHTIRLIPDGQQALAFLRRGDGFADAPRPDLILLDLSLPGLNGQEVLKLIKNNDDLKTIPVVIFSTLDTDESQSRAYKNCANSYVLKPSDFAQFKAIIQSIASYWSQTCRFTQMPADVAA